MTTKTQHKPKTRSNKPTLPAKPKTARAPKRAAPKPGSKSPRPKKSVAMPKTKQAIIQNLVERSDGASIAELTQATTWQAHSVRAALTGLRKTGAEIVRTKDDGGITRYRIDSDNSKQASRKGSER